MPEHSRMQIGMVADIPVFDAEEAPDDATEQKLCSVGIRTFKTLEDSNML
jgi:hypothetical protein